VIPKQGRREGVKEIIWNEKKLKAHSPFPSILHARGH
jgi:hypothetical protein